MSAIPTISPLSPSDPRSAPATINPPGHTRLPRYVRGHAGTIAAIHGCHVFPDTSAHGGGEQPQWLYSVRFDCGVLWGGDNPEGDEIFIDLWEPYLEQF